MNILTAIIIGIDNAGVNAQEKGVNKLGGKDYAIFKSEESFKGYSGMANTTQNVCKRRKEKLFGKASRTEQLCSFRFSTHT